MDTACYIWTVTLKTMVDQSYFYCASFRLGKKKLWYRDFVLWESSLEAQVSVHVVRSRGRHSTFTKRHLVPD